MVKIEFETDNAAFEDFDTEIITILKESDGGDNEILIIDLVKREMLLICGTCGWKFWVKR